jgi:hypothetical protein
MVQSTKDSVPEINSITSLLFIEDLSEELEKKFVSLHLKPYF